MGGAMLAAVGCGAYPDVETIGKKMAHVVDTVEPEEELVAKYEECYQRFRKLYPTLTPYFNKKEYLEIMMHDFWVSFL